MTKRHEQRISIKREFIPLVRDLAVELGDSIQFCVKGGTAWVMIPGGALVMADQPHGEAGLRPDEEEKPGPFTAFVVTERTPVLLKVVGRARSEEERVLSYSVLCDPGGDGRAYYAQGASPPRIRLPPPKL